MTTDDHASEGEQPNHEQVMARLLELQEAKEARRQNRRRALPWVIIVAVVLAFGGGLWWNAAQDEQISEQRACERFQELSGTDGDC